MKPAIKSPGISSGITRCLVMLSLCLPLHAFGDDFAEFGKAAFDGNVERVRELLNKNPEFLNGSVKELIAGKADLNTRDMDGATPLHYAADKGKHDIYELLVTAGAEMDAMAQKGPYAGKTPRQIAESHVETARPDPILIKSINSMRILGLALHEFATKQGSFPNKATAKALEKTFPQSVKTDPASADDYLKQVALVYSDPTFLNACMTGDGAGNRWFCSYIPGASPMSNPKSPVALLPLTDGKPLFDAAALSGKAVILFADNSVRSFSVEADGRVLIDGLDIFDPKQPFWENSKPDIKWPKQPEK